MGQVGWRNPVNGQEESFDYWLTEAASKGEALGYPYEVLLGMRKQADRTDRPTGFSATMLSRCARAIYLDGKVDYYSEPENNYPGFRGTIGHSMLEQNAHPGAQVERRLYRMYRGEALSGQLDKVRLILPGRAFHEEEAELLRQWLSWCDQMFAFEMMEEMVDEDQAPEAPILPDGAEFLIEDWKTKHELPFGNYVFAKHQAQGNIYRWLLRVPRDQVTVRFVYVSMEGVKSLQMYNGGTYSNGRAKPVQMLTDAEIGEVLDDRLRVLVLQRKKDKPLPYAKVPTEDLFECKYCPVREVCYERAAVEAREAWQAGQDVSRIPPRDKEDEEKVKLPGKGRKKKDA